MPGNRLEWAYNLIDHHQSPGFGMFNTFHVTKYADPKALIEATIHGTTIGSSTGQWLGVAGFEEEDICSSILCAEINMTENT